MPGSLPVIASFCARAGIAEVIDELAPVRNVATLTAGQAVVAMICNRLTSPAPLVHVQDWARIWAVPEILGTDPLALNDDKLGRTLDTIAPHLDEITSGIAVRAITEFGIDMSQLHWDMTSFSLYGAYDSVDDDYPVPRHGKPKDRRSDLKQYQAGIAATGDGGIPIHHKAYSGGAAEISQVTGAMTALKKLAGPKTFLLIGDSKLISYDNVEAITGQRCTFLAPASKTYVKAAELAACDLARATEVDYVAARDAGKDPGRIGRWYVLEDDQPFEIRSSKRKNAPPIRLRRIFVHSTARAQGAATSRAKKLARARDDLDRLTRSLGSRYYPDEKSVTDRIKKIASDRKAAPYLCCTAGTDPGTGKPTLAWHFDQSVIDAEAATDGWYALLTNLATGITAGQVLRRYKGQEAVERRYSHLKGPLAVAPLFLKNNRRIAALITVISLALLIFCLIEREARRNLAPQTKVDGLYNRQPARPTGRLILTALASLRLIPATATTPAQITRPTPVQARLLELLGVDPTRPP
jgi:hypothetical protein